MRDRRSRPRGRPPLDMNSPSPSASVHLKLAAVDFDDAERLAKMRRESIQDVIRHSLKRFIKNPHI